MGFFLSSIAKRVTTRNQNFMGVICGQTGSGKSYAALRIAEKLSEDVGVHFTIDNVAFKPEEFLEIINSNRPNGSVIIFDEVGVGLDSKKWYSSINIMINYVLQTFRVDNYIVLFTTPDFGFIDSSARKVLHAYFEAKRINYQSSTCTVKPFLIQNNPKISKMYFKYPQVKIGNSMRKLKILNVSLPSKGIIKAYEEKSREFKKELKHKVYTNIVETGDTRWRLTDVEKTCYKLNRQGYTQVQIAKAIGITQPNVSKALKRAKSKGHEVLIFSQKQASNVEIIDDIPPRL